MNRFRAVSTAGGRVARVMVSIFAVLLFLSGCASKPLADMRVQTSDGKNIFIFLDGTGNTAYSQSNVRRMYEMISAEAGVDTVTIYMEGVGDARHPVTGMMFGKGMNYRIEAAYAELIKIYKPGDRLYIFGFSRGAHIARALAGLVSYAGLPELDTKPRTPSDYFDIARDINSITKKHEESDWLEYWKKWNKDQAPPMASLLTQYPMRTVSIEMLGVWDTVPGSAFKDYGDCIEERGRNKGIRYKTNSYPTIKRVLHAMSMDEKRSRFAPLHVCKELNGKYTTVEEMYFPGAHSDVGGGYSGAHAFELPDISLKWMFEHLSVSYPVPEVAKRIEGNPKGLAHWSRSGFVNVLFNSCKDRELKKVGRDLPETKTHPSYDKRRAAAPVLLQLGEEDPNTPAKPAPYPMTCQQFEQANR